MKIGTIGKVISTILAMAMTVSLSACNGNVKSGSSSAMATSPVSQSGTKSGTAFDSYTRPTIVSSGKIKVGYVHTKDDAEYAQRVTHQLKIEVAHRGWTIVDAEYSSDQDCRSAILNLINQKVDAIIMTTAAAMNAKEDLVLKARTAGIGVYNISNTLVPGIISNINIPIGTVGMDLVYKIGEDHYWKDGIGVITLSGIQNAKELTDPMTAVFKLYTSETILATGDCMSSATSIQQAAFNYAQNWVQKYGSKLTGIICNSDYTGIPVTEAIMQSGDKSGDKTWVSGIDGGSQAWAYIRNKTPYQYSYAQPFELYMHDTCELINELQVEGLNPGDKGCLLSKAGTTIFTDGVLITRDNVPAIGTNINSVFSYYKSSDSSAWYNWTDAGGPYKVTNGKSQ